MRHVPFQGRAYFILFDFNLYSYLYFIYLFIYQRTRSSNSMGLDGPSGREQSKSVQRSEQEHPLQGVEASLPPDYQTLNG